MDLGQPLGRVDDADLRLGQAQRRPQSRVGLGMDAAVSRPRQVARNTIGLAVVEGREDPIARLQRGCPGDRVACHVRPQSRR